MEPAAVCDQIGGREHASNGRGHVRGHVQGHFTNALTQRQWEFSQHVDDLLHPCAPDDRNQAAFSAFRVLVGQNRVQLTLAQRHLVDAQPFAHVLRIQQILPGLRFVLPLAIPAELVLVDAGEIGGVDPAMFGDGLERLLARFDLHLLKKPQDRRSCGSHQP